MLEKDLKYSKIEKLNYRPGVWPKVREIYEKNYLRLKNIYLYYIANSKSYPRMNVQDFSRLCSRSKIFDRNLNTQTMERNFVATNASTNGYKNPSDKVLNRYEFLELLIRMSKAKYQDPKVCHDLHEALGEYNPVTLIDLFINQFLINYRLYNN